MYENLMFAMCQAWNTYECGIWSWINDWSKAGSSVSPPENLQVGSDCLSIQCPFFWAVKSPTPFVEQWENHPKWFAMLDFLRIFRPPFGSMSNALLSVRWSQIFWPPRLRDLKKMLWGIPKSPWLFQYHNGFYIILDGLGIHHLRKPPLY